MEAETAWKSRVALGDSDLPSSRFGPAGRDTPSGSAASDGADRTLRYPALLAPRDPPLYSLEFASVKKYLDFYGKEPGRTWLERGLKASIPFRNYFYTLLRKYGVPEEVFYLVLVESDFVIGAVSRSGAAGLWQIMPDSAGPGIAQTLWTDERYDFQKASIVAIEKLLFNYRSLGDWSLAFAAYNAGLNRILQIQKRTGAKTFWDLENDASLPAETKEYVPKIIAAAHLGKQAGRQKMEMLWPKPVYWDKIVVPGSFNYRDLEEALGIPFGILARFHGEFRFETNDPGKEEHYLRIPRDYLPRALDFFSESLGH